MIPPLPAPTITPRNYRLAALSVDKTIHKRRNLTKLPLGLLQLGENI